ncbi:glycosyltransferase family 2 protein [Algibacter sp. Ld11]|uniref:glycosyltransferase family 2 protein n=1 Tax=Algibacter sp. Ld11 TaxID=649150 RepID=UPI003870E803
MKFSIIIPVYNLELYINKCLHSLLNQNFEKDDYEVIIINDGSTDKSETLISKVIKNENNFTLFSIKNQGVSNARNFGLTKASGEYVQFVDGDDWLNNNTLNIVYDKIVKTPNLEVLKFGYTKRLSNGSDVEISIVEETNVISGLDFILETSSDSFYPWQYFISRNLLIEQRITFNKNLSFSEDKEFLIRLLSVTKRFRNYKNIIYNYNLQRTDAVTSNISDKSIKSLIDANYCIYKYVEQSAFDKKYKNIIINNVLQSLNLSYYTLTQDSIWSRFWIWKKNIYPILNSLKSNKKNHLNLLRLSPLLFYLKNYLPRAIAHQIKKKYV